VLLQHETSLLHFFELSQLFLHVLQNSLRRCRWKSKILACDRGVYLSCKVEWIDILQINIKGTVKWFNIHVAIEIYYKVLIKKVWLLANLKYHDYRSMMTSKFKLLKFWSQHTNVKEHSITENCFGFVCTEMLTKKALALFLMISYRYH